MRDWDKFGESLTNADFEPVNLTMPVRTEGKTDDWVATCGVCMGNFSIAAEDCPDNPSSSGTFCPDCRARRMKAPGVLHWRKRSKDN